MGLVRARLSVTVGLYPQTPFHFNYYYYFLKDRLSLGCPRLSLNSLSWTSLDRAVLPPQRWEGNNLKVYSGSWFKPRAGWFHCFGLKMRQKSTSTRDLVRKWLLISWQPESQDRDGENEFGDTTQSLKV